MNENTSTNEAVKAVTPRQARAKCAEGALLLDVREEYLNQHKQFDVPSVIQIPFSKLKNEHTQLPPDKLIIVADSSGLVSGEAATILQANGHSQVATLAGGLVEWERDGMPMVIDKGQQLSGSCACQLRAREKRKNDGIGKP